MLNAGSRAPCCRPSVFGKEVETKGCVVCDCKCEVADSTTWWGFGANAFVQGKRQDKRPDGLKGMQTADPAAATAVVATAQ